jgi:hypothetical protein
LEKSILQYGYHKISIIFENDALRPMQLAKVTSIYDLGVRGDNTGDSIADKHSYYA